MCTTCIGMAASMGCFHRAKLFELLGKRTGQPLERIEREFERDVWFSAEEARRYGLIDCIAGPCENSHHRRHG